MTAPRRTKAPAGQRRPYDTESLLAVAVRVFNTRGYDGTTMEHLSAAAGIGKSSIYHHVAGKEDLLQRALSRALDSLFSTLDDLDPQESPLDQLATVVRRSVETLIRELPYVTLLLRVRGNSRVERDAMQRRREFDARVVELVSRALDDGSVTRGLDPSLTTRLIFGLVNSISEWYQPERGMDVSVIPEAVVSLVMHGLTPRASTRGISMVTRPAALTEAR
ncbi:MAG: TetR/AcrR family transcriptional regulator [Actinomycetota bacterium]|nr:TetR/AcrR family transcriptional regulator [Actinomycetota bacterium]